MSRLDVPRHVAPSKNRGKIASSYEPVRNSCDIAAIESQLVYTCDIEVVASAGQKLL